MNAGEEVSKTLEYVPRLQYPEACGLQEGERSQFSWPVSWRDSCPEEERCRHREDLSDRDNVSTYLQSVSIHTWAYNSDCPCYKHCFVTILIQAPRHEQPEADQQSLR